MVLAGSTSAQSAQGSAAPVTAPERTPVALLQQASDLVRKHRNTRGNLKEAIALFDANISSSDIPKKQRVKMYCGLARAQLRYGDLLKSKKEKLAAFNAGLKAAEEASKISGGDADALFWEAANMAKIGNTKGILNAAASVGDLMEKLKRVLKLDPNHHYARDTLAQVYAAVPGLLGGDDDKAEALFQEVIRRDPHFTPAKVSYARFLIEDGREESALRYLREVRDEKNATRIWDWKKFNRPSAKALLKKLAPDEAQRP